VSARIAIAVLAVALAAAVGMPDPVFGERVCAYVELHPGETLTLDELVRHLAESDVSKETFPERLEIVGALQPISTVVTGYRVLPVVGIVPVGLRHAPQPTEVEQVLEFSLDDLRRGFAMRRLVRRGVPFRTPTYAVDDHFIWGATARMLQLFFERIDG